MVDAVSRARRIRDVLKKKEEVQRAALVRLTSRAAQCAKEQESLLRSVDENAAFYSRFIDLISKRVSALISEAQALELERTRQHQEYCATALRQKAAQSLLEKAVQDAAAGAESKDRLVSIEALLVQALGKSVSAN